MFLSALVFGLLGSFHCVGMCGPIAFVLPVDRSNTYKKVFQITLYHIGRLLAYSIIGLVFGIIGKGLYLFGFQQQLSIVIGVAIDSNRRCCRPSYLIRISLCAPVQSGV